MGFGVDEVTVSWKAESNISKMQDCARVLVAGNSELTDVIYDSGRTDLNSLGTMLPIPMKPRTRYYWIVQVWGDGGDTAVSEVNWFETGKMDEPWIGSWISTPWDDQCIHPQMKKEIVLPSKVKHARAYVTGTGLYELSINGHRVGKEYFTPGCTAYDARLQVQTYDITEHLYKGDNEISALLGNGWAKGKFGTFPDVNRPYTDKFAFLCELHIELENGDKLVIGTDDSWLCALSQILESSIYDGEVVDAAMVSGQWDHAVVTDCPVAGKLVDRTNLPVVIKQECKPIELITTPAGETVLDMGQNMTGWLRIRVQEPAGTTIHCAYSEVLQDGNFYIDNLRTARAEFVYTSDGSRKWVQPRFTYYGFRYVKLEGFTQPVDIDNFIGCVIYSDLEETGLLETSDDKVNRLFQNALWSQRCNFLDVPTDCPQRDERMGWTGDAQVFCQTASFNMDSYAFFSNWLRDVWAEQQMQGGMVGTVVPSFLQEKQGIPDCTAGGAAVWGDAATIIPWTLYQQYGDKTILESQYESMKAWVDWLRRQDDAEGGRHLRANGFQYGDWLALDGPVQGGVEGGTEKMYIAAAYYFYSAQILAKTAGLLNKAEDASFYGALAEEIKTAIRNEYFTPNGRTDLKTQTSYVLALQFHLIPEHLRDRVAQQLYNRLKADRRHLKTGFVGTPFLCRTLSEAGLSDMAYDVFFQEDYPSWLYEVNMGATTIWERWNSILPDGHISGTDMNSLNHYAYGSIVEWMYRHMAGITPVEPGYRYFEIRPQLNWRLNCVRARYDSPLGFIESSWQREADGNITVKVTVPFGARAEVHLPYMAEQEGARQLEPGTHTINYRPEKERGTALSFSYSLNELKAQPVAAAVIAPLSSLLSRIPEGMRPDPDAPLEEAIPRMDPQIVARLRQIIDLRGMMAELAKVKPKIRDNGLRLNDALAR